MAEGSAAASSANSDPVDDSFIARRVPALIGAVAGSALAGAMFWLLVQGLDGSADRGQRFAVTASLLVVALAFPHVVARLSQRNNPMSAAAVGSVVAVVFGGGVGLILAAAGEGGRVIPAAIAMVGVVCLGPGAVPGSVALVRLVIGAVVVSAPFGEAAIGIASVAVLPVMAIVAPGRRTRPDAPSTEPR